MGGEGWGHSRLMVSSHPGHGESKKSQSRSRQDSLNGTEELLGVEVGELRRANKKTVVLSTVTK